jgi:hypothetical protein
MNASIVPPPPSSRSSFACGPIKIPPAPNHPYDAPSFDSATAAGFFSRSGSRGGSGLPSIRSPIRSSMTERANRFGSRGRFGLLAREGMVRLWHTFMSATVFKEDSKYNGSHVCPRCGSQSQWRGTDADLRMISVKCEGNCGEYNMSYDQLSNSPHFKENPISN